MDISIINPSSIKIRSKNSSIIIDPISEVGKMNCDGVVLLGIEKSDLSKVVDYRIVISGPGAYEINGMKISGQRINNELVYGILADGLSIALGKASAVTEVKNESFQSCDIAVINADSEIFDFLTRLGPKIVVLYGQYKVQGVKALGKESSQSVKKVSISKDKLPEEMEIVVLD